MILEEVEAHPHRNDLYIDKIITPHYLIKEEDKKMIKCILMKEIAFKKLETVF